MQVILSTLTAWLSLSCLLASRIAIWNHNRIISFISVGEWLVGLGLNIHGAFVFPTMRFFSHFPCLNLPSSGLGMAFSCGSFLKAALLMRKQIKDKGVVQPNIGGLCHPQSARVPGQRRRRSINRHNALHEYANRALALHAWDFNRYMVSPLPTGTFNALPFLLHWLPTPHECIIWIAFVSITEIPIVVSVFLLLDNLKRYIHINVMQVFVALNTNGMVGTQVFEKIADDSLCADRHFICSAGYPSILAFVIG